MAKNYVLLETISLTQSAASVTFDNIPQSGYTDLKVVVSARSTTSNTGYARLGLYMAVNASSSTFTGKDLLGFGSLGTGSNSYSTGRFGWINANDATANTFSSTEIYLPNYTSSANKSFSADFTTENDNGGELVGGFAANLWSTTTAISSLTFTIESSYSFSENSTFSLYGLAATGTAPSIAPKADGGNIVANDGTYWYHAFLTSGNFIPSLSLSCDILQVAGGGGGGGDAGGGGGAGGVLAFSSQTVSASVQRVVIGAGGAGGSTTSGTKGGNSQFASLTLAEGGGWGARGLGDSSTAANGGSGGGGSGRGQGSGVNPSGGTATSGQGNNGGSGSGNSTGANQSGGGGGGAGSSGSNSGSAVGGNGGAGTNTVTNWGSLSNVLTATGLGVSGYIAGGGGGSTYSGGTVGSGGSGGGGNAGNGGSAGSTNTGSGGGATRINYTGGNGASGFIVIRYAMA
jgi:hypothetical protein